MHALLDFTDCFTECDRGAIGSESSYYYEGCCPESGDLLRLPRTVQCEAIARGLMQHLAGDERHSREGKMYGVLLVETLDGTKMLLKAFSGLLNGCSAVEGWVEPIPGRDRVALAEARTLAQLESMKQEMMGLKELPQRVEYERLLREFELELGDLGDRHRTCKQQRDEKRDLLCRTLVGEILEIALEELNQASRLEGIERRQFKRNRDQKLQSLKQLIDVADERMRELKQQRKKLSRELQTQMHEAYSLVNFLGKSRSLQELMPSGSIPTGTGDCCAPKLLHCAAVHNLKPLAMAEFWWGQSSGDKIQGEFYGACSDRCQPLMGFLLSGLAQNPSISQPKAYPDFQSSANHKTRSQVRSQTFSHQPFSGGLESRPTSEENPGGTGILPVTNPQQMLPIVYEDKWLIAVNKPSGLLSVPGRYLANQDSVLSRLRNLLPDGLELTAVHRLDMGTSGILLLARDKETASQIRQQFEKRQVHKVYEAVLSGTANKQVGTIELPIAEDAENSLLQQVDWEFGKPSVTRFRVMAKQGNYDRVEFLPLTGRTHQLRVHSADVRGLGIPILGDRLYGCRAAANRLHLHARELFFEHPQLRSRLHLQVATPF